MVWQATQNLFRWDDEAHTLTAKKNGNTWQAGLFETPSVAELRERLASSEYTSLASSEHSSLGDAVTERARAAKEDTGSDSPGLDANTCDSPHRARATTATHSGATSCTATPGSVARDQQEASGCPEPSDPELKLGGLVFTNISSDARSLHLDPKSTSA